MVALKEVAAGSDQTVAAGVGRCCRPGRHVELMQDHLDVLGGGVAADSERGGDLLIGVALDEQVEDVVFSW